jgi:cytochrome b561
MRPARSSPRFPRGRFDSLVVLLHWLTLVLITTLIATGLSFSRIEGTPGFPLVLWLHRSLGVLVWTVTALRFLWRMSFARFPAWPESLGRFHHFVVTLGEYGLYALLFLQPATGLLATLLRGKPFAPFGWIVPQLLPRRIQLSLFALTAHQYGAYTLIVVVTGHALAALVHHYGTRDDILVAMAPWLRRRPLPTPIRHRPAREPARPGDPIFSRPRNEIGSPGSRKGARPGDDGLGEGAADSSATVAQI